MNIAKDCVVAFHYRLSEENGSELETSRGGAPSLCLHGHKNILPALEAAFEGKSTGDTFSITLLPEQAYGFRRDGSTQRIPIKHLMGAKAGKVKPKPGMVVSVHTEQGVRQVTVVKVGKFNIDADTNHPLADKTLTFDIEITEVRAASAEEKAHGHAHGVGGHQH